MHALIFFRRLDSCSNLAMLASVNSYSRLA